MSIKRLLSGELWGGGFRRTLWIAIGVLLLVALFFGGRLVQLYTDWLWFADIGYSAVYRRTLLVQAGLMFAVSAFFFAIVYTNLWLARSHGPRPRLYLDEQHQFRLRFAEFGRQTVTIMTIAVAAVVSLTVGMAAATGWYNFLLYQNPVSFGTADPLFGRDASFYVFTLPFLRFVYQWIGVAVVLSLIGATALYFADRQLDFGAGMPRLSAQARTHLSVLLGAGLLVKAVGYWLARYGVLFNQQRLFSGAGFTDANVRVPLLSLLAVLATLAGLSLFVYARRRDARWPLMVAGVWLVASILGAIGPAVVQQVRVTPVELQAEEPYIRHSINATRDAFNLSKIKPIDFPAAGTLKPEDLRNNADTVRNIRLWDDQPLIEAYQQLQTIRPYYTFLNADFDRYTFPDGVRQMALSVREMDVNKLEGAAQRSWINRHLIYTHGYSLCMSPVNVVAKSGLPDFVIKDFPPQAQTPPHLPLTKPQIYFGEAMSSEGGPADYVIVNSTETEFDYPAGDENKTTRYDGRTGVSLGSRWRRLIFGLRFGDPNMVLSSHVTRDSRILFGRNISERVQRIAPFLRLDGDPYPVVHDGRVVWIIDAYTISPWYPYSARHRNTQGVSDPRFNFNYIRNSVKATVDAYDGSVSLYLVDTEDPIVASLGKAFPGLFKPLSEMPEELRSHLRYPVDLFGYQALVYRTYHMTEPRVFYNREDMWELPSLRSRQGEAGARMPNAPMQPYYSMMKLPGGNKAEYILMLPFTPTGGKINMIAWMAGRSDGANLGELVVYRFPKQKVVYGPAQVDGLIDQHPQISEKLTLWSQQGSGVWRGPVMAIPIEDSILYVEPLYLRATDSKMPELKQVIIMHGDRVEMADTLSNALSRVFSARIDAGARAGAEGGATPGQAAQPAPTPRSAASEEIRLLAQQANEHFSRAQQAQRSGDWVAYGEEMKRLGESIAAMQKLAE